MAINIKDYDEFKSNPLVISVMDKFEKDKRKAEAARDTVVVDLNELNNEYYDNHGRVAFTSIEGRVKKKDSFLRKLYKIYHQRSAKHGFTEQILRKYYGEIKDLCGVRFACPYFDEVQSFIDEIVRPGLNNWGYATRLDTGRNKKIYADKNWLDQGDDFGYRSYHFYIKVPTQVDIYGKIDRCVCEVQARSELQHVWAVRSHDLLYKLGSGFDFSDQHVPTDMKQVSNSLRALDEWLTGIRDRIRPTDSGNLP